MLKEPYMKPEIRSETLEPEALCCTGSTVCTGDHGWLQGWYNPSAGFCCDT